MQVFADYTAYSRMAMEEGENMAGNIDSIMEAYSKELKKLLGISLVKAILFGSYARGDYNNDSDIDIMVLMNVPPEQISDYADKVYDITYDFEQAYDVEINPCIQNIDIYNQWKGVYPFFINIEREGVVV